MANKKYLGVFEDAKRGTFYVSTSFTTKDGITIKKCKRGFKTAKQAELWKVQTQLEFSQKDYCEFENKKNQLTSVVDKYIKYKSANRKASTLYDIKARLTRYVIPYFDKKLNEINVNDIENFYAGISKLDLSILTKNTILSSATTFFEYLDLMEMINPTIYRKFKLICVQFKGEKKQVGKYITLDELKLILNELDTNNITTHIVNLFLKVAFFTGARRGEILALKYSDISKKNGYEITYNKQATATIKCGNNKIHTFKNRISIVPYTKTNTTKVVSIPEWLYEDIQELKYLTNADDNQYIFEKEGILLSENVIRYHLNIALKKANLEHIRVHDLRHSHTTMLYELGCDSKYVAERLGHTSDKTSKIVYEHLTNQKRLKNDNIINKIKLS